MSVVMLVQGREISNHLQLQLSQLCEGIGTSDEIEISFLVLSPDVNPESYLDRIRNDVPPKSYSEWRSRSADLAHQARSVHRSTSLDPSRFTEIMGRSQRLAALRDELRAMDVCGTRVGD